jgi:protein gp37
MTERKMEHERAPNEEEMMADKTTIEWTDATWNPITGCSLVSEGCRNCYAAELAATRLRHHPSREGLARRNADGVAKFTGEVRLSEQWLDQPLKWKKPRRIFVCAHGDLFHENVPAEWIDKVFAVMALAPHHTFQVLTKRPERMREYLKPFDQRRADALGNASLKFGYDGPLECLSWPLPNVWLGTSVEDQATANDRIPHLLATPAAIRFISAEPLLGSIDLRRIHIVNGSEIETTNAMAGNWQVADGDHFRTGKVPRLDWVIVGGESGRGARPMHPDWVRALRDQCGGADVPFFFKQWGEWHSVYDRDHDDPDWRHCPREKNSNERYLNLAGGHGFHGERVVFVRRIGKAAAGALLDGRAHREFPSAQGEKE